MMRAIKRLVDQTTMYRLVAYYLLVLLGGAFLLAAFGALSVAPLALLYSAIVLLLVAWISNEAFARFFGVVTNAESAIITALILALILQPVAFMSVSGAGLLAAVAAAAMASKYIFSLGRKHLFNPAALAAVFSAFVLGMPATWWIAGSVFLLPVVFLGGCAVVYKLHKADLVFSFGIAALAVIMLTTTGPLFAAQETLLHSAFFFFAFVMLTEPLTMPSTRPMRIVYGALIGALFAPAAHLGSFYFTPEIALVVGNAFAYFVNPKGRYALVLKERRKLSNGIYEFVFQSDRPLRFSSGQYAEWTLGKVSFDSRGNRRYFTIASAPEEESVRLGVRFYDAPSAFKRALASLPKGGVVYAGGVAGDFTLPRNEKRKLAFIAGGVGVTPFASMARHLSATGNARDAVLLYSNRIAEDIAYRDVFNRAAREGLRTVYTLTGKGPLLPGAHAGAIDAKLIQQEIPDYRERLFYISGPPRMVDAMRHLLRTFGVSRFSIKTDYFSGLA